MAGVQATFATVFLLGLIVPVPALTQTQASGEIMASSPEAASRVPELLTYQQLVTLSAEKREAYLQGVRRLLVEIAKISEEKGDDMVASQMRELGGRYAALRALVSVAGAESDQPEAAAPAAKVEDVVPRFIDTGFFSENWACEPSRSGRTNFRVRFDPRVGTCVSSALLSSGKSCEEGKFVEARLQRRSGGGKGASRYCVPKASWDLLPESRRAALSSEEGAPSVADNFRRKWFGLGNAPTGRTAVLASTVALSVKGLPIAASGGTKPVACDAGFFACDTPWEDRRRKYYDDSSVDTCIFSGNVSAFIGGRKSRGRCKPVSEIQLSETGPKYRCLEKGMTMCNPLVFSVDKDGAPFCVPAKGSATRECDRLSSEERRKPDFLAQSVGGIQESWTKFRDGFNKLCKTSEASRKFHCEECRIMSERLVALNASATGTPCGDLKEAAAMPSAGDAKKAD